MLTIILKIDFSYVIINTITPSRKQTTFTRTTRTTRTTMTTIEKLKQNNTDANNMYWEMCQQMGVDGSKMWNPLRDNNLEEALHIMRIAFDTQTGMDAKPRSVAELKECLKRNFKENCEVLPHLEVLHAQVKKIIAGRTTVYELEQARNKHLAELRSAVHNRRRRMEHEAWEAKRKADREEREAKQLAWTAENLFIPAEQSDALIEKVKKSGNLYRFAKNAKYHKWTPLEDETLRWCHKPGNNFSQSFTQFLKQVLEMTSLELEEKVIAVFGAVVEFAISQQNNPSRKTITTTVLNFISVDPDARINQLYQLCEHIEANTKKMTAPSETDKVNMPWVGVEYIHTIANKLEIDSNIVHVILVACMKKARYAPHQVAELVNELDSSWTAYAKNLRHKSVDLVQWVVKRCLEHRLQTPVTTEGHFYIWLAMLVKAGVLEQWDFRLRWNDNSIGHYDWIPVIWPMLFGSKPTYMPSPHKLVVRQSTLEYYKVADSNEYMKMMLTRYITEHHSEKNPEHMTLNSMHRFVRRIHEKPLTDYDMMEYIRSRMTGCSHRQMYPDSNFVPLSAKVDTIKRWQ